METSQHYLKSIGKCCESPLIFKKVFQIIFKIMKTKKKTVLVKKIIYFVVCSFGTEKKKKKKEKGSLEERIR